MKRVVFIVEGDTEVSFIQKRVIPYLYSKGFTNPMNAQKILTNRKLNKKGGNVGFEYLKNDVSRVAATKNVLITTLLDFFRLPTDFPGYTTDSLRLPDMEQGIKEKVTEFMDASCFLPYIQRHEIESLMYTSMDGFNVVVDDQESLDELQRIIDSYPTPEDINGGADTAPSKRLMRIFPYEKTADGEMILEALDIDDIRGKCPRFNKWMEKLEEGLKNGHFKMKNIRNFCIIAHIDHGKSTLADRLLEFTKTIQVTEGQMLDDMDLEKERGITIKSHAIQMEYEYGGEKYVLNLIDTPGHVDFSYEVSRSIAACEGALLIVDASQGVQAQTISNLYMALEHDLEIIPVLNKCDMASAMPDEVEDEIIDLLGCKHEDIIRASGKTGMGVEEILKAVVERIPHPTGDEEAPLQALIFDSVFNSFRGIIAYFKIENGVIRKGDKVKFFNTGKEYDADEIGVLKMDMIPRAELRTGDVGYIISGIKTSREVKVGDTITHIARPCEKAIAGFEEVKPMVFAGVYPIEAEDYENLRASLEKLQLNDASLTFQPESSLALGFGFRCGFLGLLHMEIVQERLDREFDMNVITTVPNVSYMVYDKQGHANEVHNPGGMPDPTLIDHIEEPFIDATIITATDYIGPIMTLCLGKRGELVRQNYVSGNRVEIHYKMPLGEIVIDFYDKLKSISKGYASFDYHQSGFRPSKLVKLDILLNGEPVDALSTLTHVDNAYNLGKRMCEKLKELIPRQQFDIAIQAAIGAKIISRETIKAVRKDVTAKCYGGDVSRKRKLLEKQKRGKKRMKQIGNVEVPQKAFLAVLKLD